MKKKTIVCSTTSAQEIINAAKKYFIENDFEVQDVITESGDLGIQARKTNWLRKCSGTSYALQVIVSQRADNRYIVTAGWGEWFSKGAVAFVATFIAFGVLLIPATIGMVKQQKLPAQCLDRITYTIASQNPVCQIYDEAA